MTAPPATAPRSVRPTEHLPARVAADLRQRLVGGEWQHGDRLPTEAELISQYGVSRSTVRSALQQLSRSGLTVTRHGIGTFVTHLGPSISAGLQDLRSMSDTIRAHGREPRMEFRAAVIRDATAAERSAIDRADPCPVLATERAVYADDELVAFSYEAIPVDLLGEDLDPATVRGSLFALLESRGVHPRSAIAEVHAVRGDGIGWGERPEDANYLRLKQTHYDASGTPIVSSDTYFIEGRFQFSILRVR